MVSTKTNLLSTWCLGGQTGSARSYGSYLESVSKGLGLVMRSFYTVCHEQDLRSRDRLGKEENSDKLQCLF